MELKELRKSCESRKIPIISPATEVFLDKILKKYKPKICLEIWGAVGYSSIYIWWVIKTWRGKITSFEVSYPAYQEGIQNTKAANCYNIISYPYDALKAPIKKLVAGPIDFIFIDGQKNQYGKYLKIVEKLSSPQTVIIIDDVMTLPLNKEDGNRFFVFINQIYETTSFIITTNKSPAEWAKSLDDETLATALLDRLLYKCQLILLKGNSYRMQNRKTIFETLNENNK